MPAIFLYCALTYTAQSYALSQAEKTFFYSRRIIINVIDTLHGQSVRPQKYRQILEMMILESIRCSNLTKADLADKKKLADTEDEYLDKLRQVAGATLAQQLLDAEADPYRNRIQKLMDANGVRFEGNLRELLIDKLLSIDADTAGAASVEAVRARCDAASLSKDLSEFLKLILMIAGDSQKEKMRAVSLEITNTIRLIESDKEIIDQALKQVLSRTFSR